MAEEPGAAAVTSASERPSMRRLVPAFVVGQVGIHAAMAGLRMAAPLQALREGHGALSVGVLLALFALAPVLLSLHAGRLADRFGYHRPVALAASLAVIGMLFAIASSFIDGPLHFALLCVAAAFSGAGANMGNLAIQRTAGLTAATATERVRMFSWLGVAPPFSNVLGPVLGGVLIDLYGFRAAYIAFLLLPLLTLWALHVVPRGLGAGQGASAADSRALDLLAVPGMKRILWVNWLISSCWDVHTFAVPILGHERGFSASTIGLILGSFTASVTAVRFAVPLVAHRLRERQVLCFSMLGTAAIFALYPLAQQPLLMACCAILLGVSLGVVQPMVLSSLHHVTPQGRHGQALALRSMALNGSSTLMPLLFGVAGSALGASVLFWSVAMVVGAGSWATRGLPDVRPG